MSAAFALKPYLAVASARLRTLLQYRVAAIAGVATQAFWGLLRVLIFIAFYASTDASQPMALGDVVSYAWLGQAFLLLNMLNLDLEIVTMVRTGNVGYELLRPVDLYGYWFSRELARRLAPTLLRFAPILALAALLGLLRPDLGLAPPASWGAFLAFALSLLAALLIATALCTLAAITLLWTTSHMGVQSVLMIGAYAFSGMIVPLPLMPGWARVIMESLPFAGLADTPFRFYTGHLPLSALAPRLALQLGWVLALALCGRWLLERGKRQLVVQGG